MPVSNISRSFQAYGLPENCLGTATVEDQHIRHSHTEEREGGRQKVRAAWSDYDALYIDWLMISLVPPGIFQTP